MSKPSPLWQLRVVTSLEAEEPVVALLERLMGVSPSVFVDVRLPQVQVTVHSPTLPRSPVALRAVVRGELDQLAQICRLDTAPGRITIKQLNPANWAEAWKRHFQPFRVGARLLVKPSWSRRRPRPGDQVMVLDPGLSFGTGQHPTTRFCLEQIAVRAPTATARATLLDVGSGSGILAIAAAKLGFKGIRALDHDPDAIRIARSNARQNAVGRRIRFEVKDLKGVAHGELGAFDLVCGNLTTDVLLQCQPILIGSVRRGGHLIVAGILRREFRLIVQSLQHQGFGLTESRVEGEWRSGVFGSQTAP